jgi:hypothetical protein
MSTSSRLAGVAALALVVLGSGAARAGYFPPPPFITQYYNYSSVGQYNANPLAFNPSYYSPMLYFRPSTAGPIFGLPATYPTPSFSPSGLYSTRSFGAPGLYSTPAFGTYGVYSTQTYGPPYTFPALADVSYYPYGTTATTTIFEPYNYSGPYLGPMLYRP